MFTIVKDLVDEKNKDDAWWKYAHGTRGRYKFQYDLGLALIEHGIKLDWKDWKDWREKRDSKSKPRYMRRERLIPCACGLCFFCKNRHTSGIDHMRGYGGPKTTKELTRTCYLNNERDTLSTSSRVCDICMQREKANHPGKTYGEIKKMPCVKSTSKGCLHCKKGGLYVCPKCWETYEHDWIRT